MTKEELVDVLLSNRNGFWTKKDASHAIDAIFRTIQEELAETGQSRVTGLGEFRIKTKKARNCFHPPSGEVRVIPKHRVIRFFPDWSFKKAARFHV